MSMSRDSDMEGSGRAPWPAFLRQTLAVARAEWRSLVYSPTTAVFQVGFLITLSLSIFVVADFFRTDVASLDLMWTFLPWIALVFAPALAMRALAEEQGDRSLELTLTLPLSPFAIVLGKWLAGCAVLLSMLALTFPFPLTVHYLGEPDTGAMLAGYLGGASLLAVYYAIALLAAASVRDEIAAFVLGLFVLAALLLSGWEMWAGLAHHVLGPDLAAAVVWMSPNTWLSRMATGRIELAAVLYTLVMTALPLLFAGLILDARRHRGTASLTGAGRMLLAGLAALALAVGAVAIAARAPAKIDLTEEREYTLHQSTRALVSRLPEGVAIDLYWSRTEPSVPAAIRIHARRVRDLLESAAAASSGRLRISEADPRPDSDTEETALTSGVRRVPMSSGDSFILGAVIRHGDRRTAIPYFDVERASHLEYDIALALSNLARERPLRVGLLSPLLSPRHATERREGLAALDEIKRQYDVAIVPHFADALPEGLDALVVLDAPILKQSMLYAIDQHVMAGRGLVVLADPYPRFNAANAVAVPEPSEAINDISDLILRYGARFEGAEVVGDRALAAPVASGDGQTTQYPFWLRIGKSELATDHPVTASLNELLFVEAGALAPVDSGATGDAGEKRFTALVSTTPAAGVMPRGEFKDQGPLLLASRFEPGTRARAIAVALSGPMTSAYPAAPEGAPSHRASIERAAVFAVADADWLFDPVALQTVDVGGRTVTRPLNDNAAALLNMIEFAAGGGEMIAIRSRGRLARPFTRVTRMLAASQERYRADEMRLLERIAAVEDRITEVQKLTGAKQVSDLPQELAGMIGELRSGLLPFRRELRAVRERMREDVERLGRQVAVFNIATPPLSALAIAFLVFRLRRRDRA
ncbi:MAG: Gldg family protein [Hyphomicrobiaceae bacterium]